MKKLTMTLALMAVLGLNVSSAWAIPPFGEAFKAKYLGDGADAKLKEAAEGAKCNVCHKGMSKKDKNEFGLAVGKFLKKGDFTGDTKKFDPKSDEGKKALADGLDKAAAEKSAGGSTFGDLIKGGKLPGG